MDANEQKKQRLREFHRKAKMLLNDGDRELLYTTLKKYQRDKKLTKLLQCMRAMLDTPTKLDLLRDIRSFIPPNQVEEYDREVPYHNMAKPLKSRSLGNLTSPKLYTHAIPIVHEAPAHVGRHVVYDPPVGSSLAYEPSALDHVLYDTPSGHVVREMPLSRRAVHSFSHNTGSGVPLRPASTHNTPQQVRRPRYLGGFAPAHSGPSLLVLMIHVGYDETLGMNIRGGSEHGLGIFVSDVEPAGASERAGLRAGDQIIEVNSVRFTSIASSSAVTVLTGSDRLKVKVRRVGKIPGHKATKEKIAWYDVEQRRLVYFDPRQEVGVQLPGSVGLNAYERKINLSKYHEDDSHLGFNIRGGAEFNLAIYISRTDRGGLAEQNGLKPGDQLVQVNGVDVTQATHTQCVQVIKAQHSLVLTVKDVGMYPAYKDVYTEYKWVDANTGQITKTRSYKKHALGGSGSIQSIPVIGSGEEDLFREQFADSRIDGLGAPADDDDLDDVMKHFQDPDSDTPMHDDWPGQPQRMNRGKNLVQSFTNLHSPDLYASPDVDVDSLVPVSSLERNKSRSEQNLAAQKSKRQCYVYNKNRPMSVYHSNGNLAESPELGFYSNRKSPMEVALDFHSIHDIHMASTRDDVIHVPVTSSMRGGDGSAMDRWHDETSTASSTPKGSVKSKRDKSAPRSSLAIKALEKEARLNHPELAAAQASHDMRTSQSEMLRHGKDGVVSMESASGKKKPKSFKERLFGSKSRDKEGSKKKMTKSRKSLADVGFNTDRAELDLHEIEAQSRLLLTDDEVEAIQRHIRTYERGGGLSRLLAPLFAILDTTDRMKLCTYIRPVLYEQDKAMFDAAVNNHFDKLDVAKLAKTDARGSPIHQARRMSQESTQSSVVRRKKRQAPLPPTSAPAASQAQPKPEVMSGSEPVAAVVAVNGTKPSGNVSPVQSGDIRRRHSPAGRGRSPVAGHRHVVVVEFNEAELRGSHDDVVIMHESRLSSVESRGRSVESRVSSVESRGRSSESRVSSVESRGRSSESRVGSVESRGRSSESRASSVESRISSEESRDRSVEARGRSTESRDPPEHAHKQVEQIQWAVEVKGETFSRDSVLGSQDTTNSSALSHSHNHVINPKHDLSPTYSPAQSPLISPKLSQRSLELHSSRSTSTPELSPRVINKHSMPAPDSPVSEQHGSPKSVHEKSEKNMFSKRPDLPHQNDADIPVATKPLGQSVNYLAKSIVSEVEASSVAVERESDKLKNASVSSAYSTERPLLSSTLDIDKLSETPENSRSKIYEVTETDETFSQDNKEEVLFIDNQNIEKGKSSMNVRSIPLAPPPPPVPEPLPLAAILTKSLQDKQRELKSVSNSKSRQIFNSAGTVQGQSDRVVSLKQQANQNGTSFKPSNQNGEIHVEDNKETEQSGVQTIEATVSHTASEKYPSEISHPGGSARADDTVSLAESTMTSASNFKTDPELPEFHYMDSSSMFPVYEAAETLKQDTSFSGNFKSPPATKRDLNASQSESVLQATAALDFLDTLDTDSQWDSSVVATHGEISGVLTPRSEVTGNGVDQSLSSSLTTLKHRDPPMFIAPPPPSEPPPSDTEDQLSDCDCSCGTSPRSSDGDQHVDSGLPSDDTLNQNGARVFDVVKNGSLFSFLDHQKDNDDPDFKGDSGQENSPDVKPSSWLFRSAKSNRPPTPVSQPHVVDDFFTPSDDVILPENGKQTAHVYLDKTFKTLGLSISGGVDSKAQPEIKVKAVFPGGAAESEGSLKAGMQIVSIDGVSLIDVTHMRAVVTIKRSFDNKANKRMAVEIQL